MRHRVAGYKLGRNASQRSALWRGLITELFRHDRISTTEAKARSMRGAAEHLITLAKHGLAEGGDAVQHAHRLAARVITDPEVTKRLFNDVAPRFVERAGGYTRMVRVGTRLGDAAEMVVLELTEKGAAEGEKKEPEAKKRRGLFGSRGRGSGSAKGSRAGKEAKGPKAPKESKATRTAKTTRTPKAPASKG